jgi:hypothetical protein
MSYFPGAFFQESEEGEIARLMGESEDMRHLVITIFGLAVQSSMATASPPALKDLHTAAHALYERIRRGERIPASVWQSFDDAARYIRQTNKKEMR